ncbi:SDR family oxidoreductase [Hyphococcus luteus]|uniref:NAD(P)-dependent oxidoreductase n=1 Tax=Hyphococcus luteus TaxID=2058213 RepID=A0A2S7K1X6_9PROT|nr:SDR family oxidoreductase [Marinicaulis flavus]PQA86510.1 NAD(P)-dependent oxidoreductase [Marinicaulis flavus]
MAEKKLLCLGYGYTARFFADRLKRRGWRIAGTTRAPEKAAALAAEGVEALIWDGGDIDPSWLDGAQAILISTPPGDEGCPAFAAAAAAIAARAGQCQWIGYLSTNGVYGDHDGAWVNEESELRATSPRAQRRIKAENQWRDFARENDLPLIVFRLPGIYGPGRSAIDTVRAGKAKRIYKESQVFSRMHVADIAKTLEASMARPRLHDVYNLADDEPAPPQDVIEYACALLGVAPPPLTPIDEADLSDMAKSFYADNKRVSNRRVKEALEVRLAFPTYREGLDAIARSLS